MQAMSLRKLAQHDFYNMLKNEPGMGPMPDPAIWAVLNQFWPEVSEGSRGNAVTSPEDAERLESLFRMFGVPMKVLENSIEVVGRAYDVFVQGLGSFVERKLSHPTTFHRYVDDWPDDWRSYIEAVAAQDNARAHEWAIKLQPLSRDCVYPPRVITPEMLKKDAERMDAEDKKLQDR